MHSQDSFAWGQAQEANSAVALYKAGEELKLEGRVHDWVSRTLKLVGLAALCSHAEVSCPSVHMSGTGGHRGSDACFFPLPLKLTLVSRDSCHTTPG